jgi:hypothetical protein
MMNQMNYEVARERMADYQRRGEQARRVREVMSQRREAKAMRFSNAADMVAKIIGRWGWMAAQPATRN